MSKQNYLNELIENSSLEGQQKMNKIINTLMLTEDQIKAKILSKKILAGDFGGINDATIDNLIHAFNGVSPKVEQIDTIKNESEIKEEVVDNSSNESDIAQQEIAALMLEIKKLKKDFENKTNEIEKSYREQIAMISQENMKLREMVKLTNISTPIRVDSDDINELYIRHKADGTTKHGEAFIVDGILPVEYYRI